MLWLGLLKSGVHPTLAGVILGLLTPTVPSDARRPTLHAAARALREFGRRARTSYRDVHELMPPLRELKNAQRELLPPAVRVQTALHPWVAYGVMPLFALANAGIGLQELSIGSAASQGIALGIFSGLVFGKPAGILLVSWLVVRIGWCRLPAEVTWRGIAVVGCLGGIGFTMAIFIATLAFADDSFLGAAKSGVLAGSAAAGLLGLLLGRLLLTSRPRSVLGQDDGAAPRSIPCERRS